MNKIKLLFFIITTGLIFSFPISCSDDSESNGHTYHKPGKPSWVNATRGTYKDRIEIDWGKVPDSEKYVIYKSIDNKNDFKVIASNIKDSFFNDTNITPNRNYYYKVSAANGDQWSEKSEDTLGFAHTGKPLPPEITSVSNDIIGMIKIEWAATPQTDSYIIQRSERSNGGFEEIIDPEVTPSKGLTSLIYSDKTIAERDKLYYYRIISINEEGESIPSEPAAGIALQDIPLIQEDFKITASIGDDAFGNKIVIEWDKIDLAKTYSIYRAESEDGEYIKISGGLVPDSYGKCFYEDTGAAQETDYFYKITAVSSGGESEKSVFAQGYVDPDKPNQATAPVNVAATNGEFGSITITWDPVDGATKYHIYRNTQINETGEAKYELVTDSIEITDNSFTDISTVLTNDLNSFRNFFYRVTAFNGAESRPSVPVQGYAKPLIPLVPENFSVSKNRTDAKIILSFNLCANTAKYHIYRSENIDGTFNKIASAPGTGAAVYEENFSSMQPEYTEVGKTFYYKISASNISGESEQSDYGEGNTALQIPDNIKVEKNANYQRKLTWAPVPHATAYIIEHKAGSKGSWTEYTVTSTEYVFSKLKNTTTHYWRVRAINNNTESETSQEVDSYVL